MSSEYGEIIFLDTNIILDYIENRNADVKKFVDKLIKLHLAEKITLATSLYNIAETLDIEFEISFFIECMKRKMTGDDILSKSRNRGSALFCNIKDEKKEAIKKKMKRFLDRSGIEVLHSNIEDVALFQTLLYDKSIRSQDAMISYTAKTNGTEYFLTNDNNLASQLAGIMRVYNIRDSELRDRFQRTVLDLIY